MARRYKVHRNFKLAPDLDKRLRSRAARLRRTQTQILEDALAAWLTPKRGVA